MKFLGTLLLAIALTCTVAVPALADAPCLPGDIQGPPCSSAPVTSGDPTAPGQTEAPPAANSVDFGTLAEMALHTLLSF